jgi:hypothetical protein
MKSMYAFAGVAALLMGALPARAHAQRPDSRGRPSPSQARHAQPRQLSPREQQQRIDEQRQRDAEYQRRLAQQVQSGRQRAAAMQTQRRNAQYAAQQQYLLNLRQQQLRMQQRRDYSRDQAYRLAPIYRYNRGGTYYQTNQYGAEVLKRAVDYGYQQGVRFGQADRNDRVPSNYQSSYAYQDANYGYDGQYVSQSDYNYYFREGFRRGYEDGYGSRSQYGSINNGSGSILGNILSGILGLQPIQ